ncbi:Ubiquitin-related modifier 1 [Oleoguttula sp. CCFEE 5521]
MAEYASIPLTIEFTGGLELLFSNQRKHKINLPSSIQSPNVADLITYLCDNLMKDPRKDIRPGILVLINDADWELEGQETYQLQPRDEIVFVSTLHGG